MKSTLQLHGVDNIIGVTKIKKRNEIVLDKKLQKEIKAKEKAEKAKEKAERVAMLEKIRQSKPGQCMKYVTIILDENLVNCNIGKKAVELFTDVEFNYKVEAQRDSCSVTWTREEPGSFPTVTKEKHILIVWSYDKLITAVKFCNLIETFKELKNHYVDFRIYLAIYGLGDYYKRTFKKNNDGISNEEGGAVRKKRKTLDIPKEQIDMALAELEILLKISTRLIKNHHELSTLFKQITKAIAETPYRKEIEKRDQEKGWYTRGDSRDCVKIDKDLNGLHRLWLQQLSQFNKSSLDAAKSIAEVYPSPASLYQAYENLSTQKEKELLLQDIKIKKGGTSIRRIGPELSRKVSLLFSQEDGDIFLSQE
ncbi:hypothetical protein O3M35_006493 [Rhynocoris fuscipes]|uniref:Crossover junction endonuclease EME1 n=1 Tax=Rhynocoris fuscipes TaxID=488301 RepID=A0AAW1DDQ6_9HEMI